ELIDLTLRALLNDGDEVLVPSPDYPLWTAAVTLNRGRAVHYACRPENAFVPDPEEVARLVSARTRAIVIINPNNPTGAVYPRAVLEALASLRLCSSVPAQWAVQTALGGFQSIRELVAPGGRLHESRGAISRAVAQSRFLTLAPPGGAMYAFIGVDAGALPDFDDQQFAL